VLSGFDYSTILISLVAVIFVALRVSRSSDKPSGATYFLAGRNLTWSFVGMSVFMTNISAMLVIGLAGDGHRVGLAVAGYELMGAWDLVMLAAFFASVYLKSQVFTIPEFLERRFGWGVRAYLFTDLMRMNVFTRSAIILWAGSLLFASLFGWNQLVVMIVLSNLTGLYMVKDVLKAVVYADMVQGNWLIAGSSVLTASAALTWPKPTS